MQDLASVPIEISCDTAEWFMATFFPKMLWVYPYHVVLYTDTTHPFSKVEITHCHADYKLHSKTKVKCI